MSNGWTVLGAAVGFAIGMTIGLWAVYVWAINGPQHVQAILGGGPAAIGLLAGQWLGGSYSLRRKYGRWRP